MEPFPSPTSLKQAGTGSPCSSFSPLPGCRALPLPSLLSGDPEPFPDLLSRGEGWPDPTSPPPPPPEGLYSLRHLGSYRRSRRR